MNSVEFCFGEKIFIRNHSLADVLYFFFFVVMDEELIPELWGHILLQLWLLVVVIMILIIMSIFEKVKRLD